MGWCIWINVVVVDMDGDGGYGIVFEIVAGCEPPTPTLKLGGLEIFPKQFLYFFL